MLRKENSKSEIATILKQIEEEYYASKQGLDGFAACARHDFITARMENMDTLHHSLREIVGDEAIALIAGRLDTLEEGRKETYVITQPTISSETRRSV